MVVSTMYFLLPIKRLLTELLLAATAAAAAVLVAVLVLVACVHCSVLACIALGARKAWGSSWISALYLWLLLIFEKVDASVFVLEQSPNIVIHPSFFLLHFQQTRDKTSNTVTKTDSTIVTVSTTSHHNVVVTSSILVGDKVSAVKWMRRMSCLTITLALWVSLEMT